MTWTVYARIISSDLIGLSGKVTSRVRNREIGREASALHWLSPTYEPYIVRIRIKSMVER